MGTIKRNFVYNVSYQILAILLPLVTAPYISRTLGATAVGVYSYTHSVAYYFSMIAMLGISNHGNRSIAAVREDQEQLNYTFCCIYTLQVINFIIWIICYIGYALLIVKENQLIVFLQSFYVISGIFDISWLFFGLEKFKLTVSRNIIIKIATVILMFALVHEPTDLWKYTLIMSGGTVCSQAYLWFYVKRYIRFTKVSIIDVIKNVRPVLILFIPVLCYSIYKFMDKIMLGNISTYAEVGYYQNAEKIVNIPMGVITALGTVMLPRMSNLIANNDLEKSEQYIRISFKVVTMIGSAIAFGLIGITDVLTPVFFGVDFLPTAPIISLLSISVFFIAWANVIRTQYLIPHNMDKIYLASTMIGAGLNLLINILLIPQYEAIGAAIGTIVAEFALMFIQMIYIRKSLPIGRYFKDVFPIILIGIFMAIIVRSIGRFMDVGIGTLIIQVCVGGGVYIALLVIYFVLFKDEMGNYLLKLKKF